MSFELRAPHTHLYPGLRLRFGAGEAPVCDTGAGEVHGVVEFADGRAAGATLERLAADGAVLRVESWTTAAGTTVAARRWRLEWWPAHGAAEGLRVTRRLPDADG